MDITNATTELGNAADKARQHASNAAGSAKHEIQHVGHEIHSFVEKRPVEVALLSAAIACVITGLAFWVSRPD